MAEFYQRLNEHMDLEGDRAYDSNEEVADELEDKRGDYRRKSGKWSVATLTLLGGGAASGTYGAGVSGEFGAVGAAVGGVAALLSGANAYINKNKMETAEKQRREVAYGTEENIDMETVASMLEPEK
jgi:hypothetical protein